MRLDLLPRAGRARVGNKQVEAPEIRDRLLHHALAIARVADVAGRRDGLASLGRELGDGLSTAGIVGEKIDRDRGAVAGEQRRGGEPDPRRAAGHERGLAGQVVGDHGCLRCVCFAGLRRAQ